MRDRLNRQKMKIDYRNFVRIVTDTLCTSLSEDPETVYLAVKDNAFCISVGFELLTSYLEAIAKHAIDNNDAALLELLRGLCVVEEREGKT